MILQAEYDLDQACKLPEHRRRRDLIKGYRQGEDRFRSEREDMRADWCAQLDVDELKRQP